MTFELSPIKVFRFLLRLAVVLTMANLVGVLARSVSGHGAFIDLIQLFDFDSEKNIPTLYSSINLLFCAVLLAIIALQHKAAKSSWFPWAGLAAIFCFLSVDETAQFHEKLSQPARQLFDLPGLLYYAWAIPYVVLVGVLFLLYFKFLMRLPKKTRYLFITAGVLFVLGAVGFELIGGWQSQLALTKNTLQYRLIYTCEEFLEMFGVITFIYALFDYAIAKFDVFSVRVHKGARKTERAKASSVL